MRHTADADHTTDDNNACSALERDLSSSERGVRHLLPRSEHIHLLPHDQQRGLLLTWRAVLRRSLRADVSWLLAACTQAGRETDDASASREIGGAEERLKKRP